MFDYDVEVIRGSDKEIADWLSRSSESIDHEDVHLAEEYVVNEVKVRMEGTSHEYGKR